MLNKKNNALWMMAILFLFATSFQQKEIFKKSGFSTVKITFNNTRNTRKPNT